LRDECTLARTAFLTLRKASGLVAEGVDRTPPTVSSRPLLESASSLLASAYNLMLELLEMLCQS